MHAPRISLEEIEHESSARPQVTIGGVQAGELVFDDQQMLESAEGNGHESERLAKIETGHAFSHDSHARPNPVRLPFEFGTQLREH